MSVYDVLSPFGFVTMARRLCNPVALLHVVAVAALLVCLVSARERRTFNDREHDARLMSCPLECECKELIVDCANRGLRRIPRNLPANARRL